MPSIGKPPSVTLPRPSRWRIGKRPGIDRVAAQLVAGKARAIEKRDPRPRPRQHQRRNRTRRPGPDDQDVSQSPIVNQQSVNRQSMNLSIANPQSSIVSLAEHDGTVLGSEAKAIAERRLDLDVATDVRDHIDVARCRERAVVDRRRQEAVAQAPARRSRCRRRRSRPADGRSSTWSMSPRSGRRGRRRSAATHRASTASLSCVDVPW